MGRRHLDSHCRSSAVLFTDISAAFYSAVLECAGEEHLGRGSEQVHGDAASRNTIEQIVASDDGDTQARRRSAADLH